MSIDLKLDTNTNDITFKDGKFLPISTTLDEARQRIQVRLRAWSGQWFLDNTFGLPYKEQIIKKNVKREDIDALVISTINEVEIVNNISSFSSIILGRVYIVRFVANVTVEPVSNIRGSTYQEYTYPENAVDEPVLPCLDEPETSPTTFNIELNYTMGM